MLQERRQEAGGSHFVGFPEKPCVCVCVCVCVCFPLVAQRLKCLPTMQETSVQSLGREDPLEKEVAILQNSCLENPMDGGAWWATVHGVTKSRT